MAGLELQVAGKTDVGLVRANNEDCLGYDTRFGIFVVCDGMGGQAAGERASKTATEAVLAYFRQEARLRTMQVVGRAFDGVSARANALASAIQIANQAIHEEALRHEEWKGMGSTIVAVLVEDAFFSIASVGDSRIYLFRDGAIQQLTTDHSLVMEQVRRGLMSRAEAENSHLQNVIVRSLGAEESVEPDLEDYEFKAEDVLMLCSDGLSRFVSEDGMVDILRQGAGIGDMCRQLIEAAKAARSDDNITCLLLRAVEPSQGMRILKSLVPRSHKLQTLGLKDTYAV